MMTFEAKLARINELAKIAKTRELTKKEKDERHKLRQDYIKNFRKSFTNQFKTMKVIDPEGNDVTPQKVRDLQARNKKH